MRKALNENPKVQAGAIVVLLIVGVLMFMKMKGASEAPVDESGATASASATGVTGSGAGAVSADGTAAAPTADPATGAPAVAPTAAAVPVVPTATGTVTPEALVPGPGFPAEVAQAFARGNAIVLLIVKPGGTDDDLVRTSVNRISKPGTSVFVAPASRVARYSRITQGVGLSRVPALIVVRPRSVGGDAPQATISYGFRNAQSVVQAVDDALYDGRDDVPYHPG